MTEKGLYENRGKSGRKKVSYILRGKYRKIDQNARANGSHLVGGERWGS